MKTNPKRIKRMARSRPLAGQRGAILLEALLAVVIFAAGILGLIGLQARAIKMTEDMQYVNRAAVLANQIIAQGYLVDPTNVDGLLNPGTTANDAWKAVVTAAMPGASLAGNAPVATFTASPVTVNNVTQLDSKKQYAADVTIHWQLPHGSQRTYHVTGAVNTW